MPCFAQCPYRSTIIFASPSLNTNLLQKAALFIFLSFGYNNIAKRIYISQISRQKNDIPNFFGLITSTTPRLSLLFFFVR